MAAIRLDISGQGFKWPEMIVRVSIAGTAVEVKP
jgi:hypothetical protein